MLRCCSGSARPQQSRGRAASSVGLQQQKQTLTQPQVQLLRSSSCQVSSSRQHGQLPTGRPKDAAGPLLLQTFLTHRLMTQSLHHLSSRNRSMMRMYHSNRSSRVLRCCSGSRAPQ